MMMNTLTFKTNESIMKKNLIIIIFLFQAVFTTITAGNVVTGTVMLNGNEISAEYTLNGSEAWLGSGRNACISQYSEGEVEVPATIQVGGVSYPVTGVSDVAFRLCTKITSVTLPENVKSVGDFAFNGCQSLTKVSLPSTTETIGSGAFIDLPNLKEFIVMATTPPTWEYNDVFFFHEGGIGSTQAKYIGSIKLYVPEESIESYETSTFSNADLGWTTPDGWGSSENIFAVETYGIDLVLEDAGTDNSTLISECENGKAINVMLKNRTFYMDGKWNTMCLPFNLSAEQLSASPLAGADIRALATATVTGHHVDLYFGSNENSITAGIPYIIKWEPDTENPTITNPTFKGVTINSATNNFVSEDGHVNFIGYYDAFTILPTDNPLVYYLTSGNQLIYTAKERTLKACRAYFIFTPNDGSNTNSFTFNINFGDGLNSIQNVKSYNHEEDIWFDLSGRRLNGKPIQKGIYVTKGHKTVIE